MTFSHAGELGSTCDICGRKFVHKHFNPVKAGHLTVCLDTQCIIDAMHNTGVPRLAISEDMIVDRLSKHFKIDASKVEFHIELAKAVYEVMENPLIQSVGGILLLEAIVANQFPSTDSDLATEYAQAIDVLLKPYGIPYGRKRIDTNYPFATVVSGSAHGMQVPWVLYDLRGNTKASGNLYETYLRNYRYEVFDAIKVADTYIFGTQSCSNLRVTRETIVLGQIYMFKMQQRSIFGNYKDFKAFLLRLNNNIGLIDTEFKPILDDIRKIIENDKLNYHDMLSETMDIINKYTSTEIKL